MKKRAIPFLIILIIAILVATFLFDIEIIKFIVSLRNVILDYIFISVAFASNAILILFFLTTLFLWKEHKRRWIFPLWVSCFLSLVLSFLIKIIVKRPRPFEEGIPALRIVFIFLMDNLNTWNFSFPSFQAMLAFSALPVLDKEFKKFKYIWLIFACFIAFSRVYFGVHYLSDVIAGALIGYLTGFLMVKIEDKYKIGTRIIKKMKL